MVIKFYQTLVDKNVEKNTCKGLFLVAQLPTETLKVAGKKRSSRVYLNICGTVSSFFANFLLHKLYMEQNPFNQ